MTHYVGHYMWWMCTTQRAWFIQIIHKRDRTFCTSQIYHSTLYATWICKCSPDRKLPCVWIFFIQMDRNQFVIETMCLTSHFAHAQGDPGIYCSPICLPDSITAENAKFAGPSDRRGYFLSGSGKHPSITGPCDRLIVHCSPFLPHTCAKLHLQWVCQKASGSAKNLVSAGPVVWHIKKSFRILCNGYWIW